VRYVRPVLVRWVRHLISKGVGAPSTSDVCVGRFAREGSSGSLCLILRPWLLGGLLFFKGSWDRVDIVGGGAFCEICSGASLFLVEVGDVFSWSL